MRVAMTFEKSRHMATLFWDRSIVVQEMRNGRAFICKKKKKSILTSFEDLYTAAHFILDSKVVKSLQRPDIKPLHNAL